MSAAMKNSSVIIANNSARADTANYSLDSLFDDLTDFAETQRFVSEFTRVVTITYDFNISFGVILGVISCILMSSCSDKNLRSNSKMWYIYHFVAMVTFTALVLHATAHAGWIFSEFNTSLCFFLMYTTSYIFQSLGTNIVLINLEIFFTTILPVDLFRRSRVFRFAVLILSMWLLNCLLVSHLIIQNNTGKDGRYNCLILSENVWKTVDIIRTLVPGIICCLFSFAILGKLVLGRFRTGNLSSHDFAIGDSASSEDKNDNWVWCVLTLNAIFVFRVIMEMSLLMYEEMSYTVLFTRRQLAAIVAIHVLRSQCLYFMPMPLFLLAQVRKALKHNCCKLIEYITLRRIRLNVNQEDVKVRFTNQLDDTEDA